LGGFDSFELFRSPTRKQLGFGKGAHLCVGGALVRLEARIVLRVLLEQIAWIEAADVGRWLPRIVVRPTRGKGRISEMRLTQLLIDVD
jgi:cytochrome P450